MTATVVGVVAVSCLYWAQAVFVPVAMAVFLTFLLAPLVAALRRRGLRRTPSVRLVVLADLPGSSGERHATDLRGELGLLGSQSLSTRTLPEVLQQCRTTMKSAFTGGNDQALRAGPVEGPPSL